MILLTGSNGFLGRELLLRLLEETEESIAVVLRDSKNADAEARARNLLQDLFGTTASDYRSRVRVVRGELSSRYFGLSEGDFASLAGELTSIYHCAADTNLAQSLRSARKANVRSTENVLELCRFREGANDFSGFFHISSAYVAGDTERTVLESELSFSQGFRNSYEQSKAEAEQLVEQWRGRVPTCIFRPSVIVGDSKTGKTSAFHTIYIPARLLAQGGLKVVPAMPSTPFDVVPVDYVADSILSLSRSTSRLAERYHLCAGFGRESNPFEVLQFVIKVFELYTIRGLERSPIPHFLAPELAARLAWSIRSVSVKARLSVRQLEKILGRRIDAIAHTLPFLPYMMKNPRFDTSATVRDLGGTRSPLFSEYAERLFRYCVESDWGRIPARSHS